MCKVNQYLFDSTSERLGYESDESVKQHAWFDDIQWDNVYSMKSLDIVRIKF